MHTIETTLTLSLILGVLAVLFFSLPVSYAHVRETCAVSASAEIRRVDRNSLLTVATLQVGDTAVPVVASSPETVYEWAGMLDETASTVVGLIEEISAYFGTGS